MRTSAALPSGLLLAVALLLGAAGAAQAQDPIQEPLGETRDEIRVGIALGGTGFLGLVTEYRRGSWGAELTLGSITFREVAVAVSGKRYFTDGRLRPAVGLGFWSLTAWTDDGSGSVLILRAPFAVDWRVTGGHSLGVEVGLNRAVAVNRLDPQDDTPPNSNLVPLPGLYYRHGWER